ncbi:uncharacterized protein [Sinocyclocheilus grahami]|uniref:uncharacterized protein n=1 Tax=Sinocyclocheilus grahami TaxID=75366 RepID=UPI0007ACBABD|nr:PREDICTED: uncharacterized protein LOC107561088 [Sinocyclocheilus grahami]
MKVKEEQDLNEVEEKHQDQKDHDVTTGEKSMHQSILLVSEKPLVPQCTSCCTMYHCSLCPALKPTTLKKIKQHWEGHLKKAIVFQDKRLCRCHLPCRNEAHYHCPNCSKTVLRRYVMETHLQICSSSDVPIQPSSSSLASQPFKTTPALVPLSFVTPPALVPLTAGTPALVTLPTTTPALALLSSALTPALSPLHPATTPAPVP